ncbi:helix-turn-helix domain-containing protein [Zhihengliuella sp.]|uniref:helix-turn-helix transcriptional regulator n=1 Tax=Zhihengliuella sp. TaxID=1954483 RepID=UPI0028111390|nr:helix-turn-helix domain-containing protein [Zhihengliuella sp.]
MTFTTTIREKIRADARHEGRDFTNSASAADYLGVTDGTLRKWRMRRYGPRFQKIGGEVRYYLSDLDAWLDAQFVDSSDGGEAR